MPAARAEIVRLDVVVTDADGKLVRDLQREDFRILEDGKPQAITQFLVVTRSPAAPGRPCRAEAPRQRSPRRRRNRSDRLPQNRPPGRGGYVAIFVDDLHIAAGPPGPHEGGPAPLRRRVPRARRPRRHRHEQRAGRGPGAHPRPRRPRRRDRRPRVRQAIVAPARGSQMTPAQAELVLRGDPSALQIATRLMVDEPGSVLGPAPAGGAGGGRRRSTPRASSMRRTGRPRRWSSARPAASSPRSCASPRSPSPRSTTSSAAWPRCPAARSACSSRTVSSSGWARATSRPATCARSSTPPRARGRSSTRSTRAGSPRAAVTPARPALRPPRACASAWTGSPRRSYARRSRAWRTTRAGSWCGGRTSSPRACRGCWKTTTPTTSWRTSRSTRSATASSGRSRCGSRVAPGSWCARAGATSPPTIASATGPSGPLCDRRPARPSRP